MIKALAVSGVLAFMPVALPMCGPSSGGGTLVQVSGYVTVNGYPSNKQWTIEVHDNQLNTTVQVQSTQYAGWSTMIRVNDTLTAKAINLPGGCQSGVASDVAARYMLNVIVPVRC